MKFDFIIGNPPYQEARETNNKQEAIYHYFYDGVSDLTDKYILISPGRFLFNAGLTPKTWNQKMLSDTHIKVLKYFPDSADVFSGVNINGGIAIVYRDATNSFSEIGTFIPNPTFRAIFEKVRSKTKESISSIMFGGRSDLKFNESFLEAFPDTRNHILNTLKTKHAAIIDLGPGEEYEIKSSAFERTPYAFSDKKPNSPNSFYRILGIENGKRVYKWIKKEYLTPRFPQNNNINKYKVFISQADGAAGTIGNPVPARIIGKPDIAGPGDSFIPSFISIGKFDTKIEAINTSKSFKTKFTRALIGILKVTQHITPEKCKYVPLQDFTPNSDIDWSKSISEIDKQLYAKYGLDKTEIDFIESHVKEMK